MHTAGHVIRKLRALDHVFRWNYHPRIKQELVSTHSFWVALIVERLTADVTDRQFRLDCMAYALYHDMEEAITGDLPSPVKRGRAWADVELKAQQEILGTTIEYVSVDVKRMVKMADALAALIFADEEVKLGNTYFAQIRGELITVVYGYKDLLLTKFADELGFREHEARPFIDEMSHL